MKKTVALVVSTLLASSFALAGGHSNGKSEEAKGMAEAIQSSGNGSSPASESKGGWGNIAGPAASNEKGSAPVTVGSKPKDSE